MNKLNTSESRRIFESRALQFAEQYGIVDYDVLGSTMVYYKNYPKYLGNNAYTVKHTVDLVTMKDSTLILKKMNKRGWNN